jgi:hypothetical protein
MVARGKLCGRAKLVGSSFSRIWPGFSDNITSLSVSILVHQVNHYNQYIRRESPSGAAALQAVGVPASSDVDFVGQCAAGAEQVVNIPQ